MAQLKITTEDFSLSSSYKCIYEFAESTAEVTRRYTTAAIPGTKDIEFSIDLLPDTHISSATLYADVGYSSFGVSDLTINGVTVEQESTANVNIDISEDATSVTVPFVFKCENTVHSTHGTIQTTNHTAWMAFSNVYLLVEYEANYTQPEFPEYTDPELVQGETYVRAVHMTELHTNINLVRVARKLSDYAFSSIVAMETSLGGWNDHVREIRAAVDEMNIAHEDWIELGENYPRLDVLLQLRRVVKAVAEA